MVLLNTTLLKNTGNPVAGKPTSGYDWDSIYKNTQIYDGQVRQTIPVPSSSKKTTTPKKTTTTTSGGGGGSSNPMLGSSPSYKLQTATRNVPVNWNPSPHPMTKPPRISWANWPAMSAIEHAYNLKDVAPGTPENRIITGRLGALYTHDQDFERQEDGATGNSRWGVQFHYNPTSISLSASSISSPDLSIEAFQQQSDTMNLLGTFGHISFDLYFNRIFDLAYPGGYEAPLKKNFGPRKEDQAAMIKKLGTNYDIEYLYRVANGDPRDNTVLGYPSADLGILVHRPCRLDIGPFKYYGVINNISVNHIMFTPNMIPTFSFVSIGFTRYAGHDGSLPTGLLVEEYDGQWSNPDGIYGSEYGSTSLPGPTIGSDTAV